MRAADEATEAARAGAARIVLKNTLYLTVAQTLSIPLSILHQAIMARYLGAEEFGYIYFAMTVGGFGLLAVNWGQGGALPALVAHEREKAGQLLGTSLVWRAIASVVVYLVLAVGLHVLGYSPGIQWALGLLFLGLALGAILSACQDTIRGFERTDVAAYAQVGQQFGAVLFVVPVLLLGARMRGALLAHAAAVAVVLFLVFRALRPAGVGALRFDKNSLRALLTGGTPFVFFGLALELQPTIDVTWLSKLAPPEVMGWYGVTRKLIGLLLFPATALIGALYPTLCRLRVTDMEGFNQTTSGALRGVSLLVVPVALGCALFPEIGISIFSREAFGPAEDNLRILALFLFLVYFTMPIGICLLAAGKQRAWTLVQLVCVATSLGLDPLLIPWAQKRFGNGGLGLCVATVSCELIMLGAGIWLAPRGIFDKRLRHTIFFALVAGAAMAVVARVARPLTPYVAAPLSVIAYAIVLRVTGAVDQAQVDQLRGFVMRRLPGRRNG